LLPYRLAAQRCLHFAGQADEAGHIVQLGQRPQHHHLDFQIAWFLVQCRAQNAQGVLAATIGQKHFGLADGVDAPGAVADTAQLSTAPHPQVAD